MYRFSGTAETLKAQLEPLIRESGATEIIVQDMLTDPDLRRRSRELVAQILAAIGTKQSKAPLEAAAKEARTAYIAAAEAALLLHLLVMLGVLVGGLRHGVTPAPWARR